MRRGCVGGGERCGGREMGLLSKPDPVSPGDKEAIDHLINWCQDKLTTWEKVAVRVMGKYEAWCMMNSGG